jgi:hypothetical protein
MLSINLPAPVPVSRRHTEWLENILRVKHVESVTTELLLTAFFLLNASEQIDVELCCVSAEMRCSVTVRADRWHRIRPIRPAVRKSAYMVNFEIRRAAHGFEWRRKIAAFTSIIASSQRVVTHCHAAPSESLHYLSELSFWSHCSRLLGSTL